MMVDREVIWSSRKGGALMIVAPWWNANSWLNLTQASPGAFL
jgi:hypothetical protein